MGKASVVLKLWRDECLVTWFPDVLIEMHVSASQHSGGGKGEDTLLFSPPTSWWRVLTSMRKTKPGLGGGGGRHSL